MTDFETQQLERNAAILRTTANAQGWKLRIIEIDDDARSIAVTLSMTLPDPVNKPKPKAGG